MVTFIVGNDEIGGKKTFLVHKEHAMHYSSVLKAAFEGHTQTYTLDDVAPTTFQLLVQWFYSQTLNLELVGNNEDESLLKQRTVTAIQVGYLFELGFLAARLLIDELEPLIMFHLELI